MSFGEHFKAARMNHGLLMKEAAVRCGVTPETIQNWEHGESEPAIAHRGTVTTFLGRDLLPPPRTLGEDMRAYRRRLGLTIKEAAKRAGVSPEGWSVWEKTSYIKDRRCREAVESLLGASDRRT